MSLLLLLLLLLQMGFAKQSQKAGGIHTRLFARAFIFQQQQQQQEEELSPPQPPVVVFVSVDVGMIGQMVKKKVREQRLEKHYTLYYVLSPGPGQPAAGLRGFVPCQKCLAFRHSHSFRTRGLFAVLALQHSYNGFYKGDI